MQREVEPFAGHWALPGGFVAPKQSLVDAAQSTLAEKTGLALEAAHLEQLASFGAPERDPRMRVVSVAWLAMVAHPADPVAGVRSLEAAWVDVTPLDTVKLGFDHGEILAAGLERARNRIEYTTLAATFCGATFTMGELRAVYETLWAQSLDPANFNRKVLASDGFVEPTGDVVASPRAVPQKLTDPVALPPCRRHWFDRRPSCRVAASSGDCPYCSGSRRAVGTVPTVQCHTPFLLWGHGKDSCCVSLRRLWARSSEVGGAMHVVRGVGNA